MIRILSTLSVLLVTAIITLSSCSSGKVAFEHGNYYQAVITAVVHLRRNPGHKKSTETLQQAYPMAVKYYEDQANGALTANAEFKWSLVVNSYTSINSMYDEIQRSPGALAVIPSPTNYNSKLQEAKQNAAEEQYAAGIMALGAGTREKAKQAYQYFKRSNEFVSGYKDVAKKMEEALWAATVKVLVEPIPTQGRNLSVSTEFFNDKLSEYLHTASINQYVRFFTNKEAQEIKLSPDHIVKLDFDEFTVGNVYMSEKEIPLRKDSVVVTTYITNSQTQVTQGNTQINQNTTNNNQNTQNNQVVNNQNNNPGNAGNNNQNQGNQGNQNQNTGNANQNQGNQGNQNQNTVNTNQNQGNQNQNTGNTNQNQGNQGNQNQNTGNTNQNQGNQGNQNQNTGNTNQNQGNQGNQNQNTGNTNQNQGNQGNQNQNTGNTNQNQGNQSTNPETKIDPIPTDEQVTICHIPPGNSAARHTVTISKSALKAHLDHGDIEGSCEDPKNANKLKEIDKKGNDPKKDEKKDDKKGNDKGNGGFVYSSSYAPLLIASSSNEQAWQTYFSSEGKTMAADTNKVYATVKATLYYYAKTIKSKGVVNFTIIDAKTNAVLSVAKIPGEYNWTSKWATFNGDERALTPQQIELSKKREQVPPSHQEMFRTFTGPIFDQIKVKITDFYRGY